VDITAARVRGGELRQRRDDGCGVPRCRAQLAVRHPDCDGVARSPDSRYTPASDIVVVTIPLKNLSDVPVAPLAGKIVIDTLNYYPQRDGHIADLDDEKTTTSELVQAHLPASKVVKAFNHIYAAELTTHGQPAGSPDRRALAIAGNDAHAKTEVAALLDQFGFDTVDVGPLGESWRIQRDTPGYGPRRTAETLRNDLAAAKRPPK
jgi:8-hydroxy-5-deazaflavin:NADPH oxidoreductase